MHKSNLPSLTAQEKRFRDIVQKSGMEVVENSYVKLGDTPMVSITFPKSQEDKKYERRLSPESLDNELRRKWAVQNEIADAFEQIVLERCNRDSVEGKPGYESDTAPGYCEFRIPNKHRLLFDDISRRTARMLGQEVASCDTIPNTELEKLQSYLRMNWQEGIAGLTGPALKLGRDNPESRRQAEEVKEFLIAEGGLGNNIKPLNNELYIVIDSNADSISFFEHQRAQAFKVFEDSKSRPEKNWSNSVLHTKTDGLSPDKDAPNGGATGYLR